MTEVQDTNDVVKTADRTKLAGEFASSVTRKMVTGKIPDGTKLDDKIMNNGVGPEPWGYIGDLMHPSKHVEGIENIVAITRVNTTEFPELVSTQMVSVTPSPDHPENQVFRIDFFEDVKLLRDNNRGLYINTYVALEIPDLKATELINKIKQDPDLLEYFYQAVFPGLDSKDMSPGIRRIQTDGFYLIQDNDLTKAGKEIDPGKYWESGTINLVKELFSHLKKYTYAQGPYGTGVGPIKSLE